MTAQIGPGLRRRQLATELTRLRTAAGKDQTQAAEVLDCSRPRISNLESGRAVPSKLELPALLTLYGAPDRGPVLEELRVAANERGWWSTFQLPAWLQAYVGLESDATTIQCFDLELVPGLLQEQSYARELLSLHRSTGHDIDRRVSVLTERQRRIGNELRLSAVVSEGLLWRTLHMGTAGSAQLNHMANMTDGGAVDLRVLTFEAGIHRSMSGSFALLQFPPDAGDCVAYKEHAVDGQLTDDQEMVGKLSTLYDDLHAMALDQGESARVISEFVTKAQNKEAQ